MGPGEREGYGGPRDVISLSLSLRLYTSQKSDNGRAGGETSRVADLVKNLLRLRLVTSQGSPYPSRSPGPTRPAAALLVPYSR